MSSKRFATPPARTSCTVDMLPGTALNAAIAQITFPFRQHSFRLLLLDEGLNWVVADLVGPLGYASVEAVFDLIRDEDRARCFMPHDPSSFGGGFIAVTSTEGLVDLVKQSRTSIDFKQELSDFLSYRVIRTLRAIQDGLSAKPEPKVFKHVGITRRSSRKPPN
jgi:hypothetical protein